MKVATLLSTAVAAALAQNVSAMRKAPLGEEGREGFAKHITLTENEGNRQLLTEDEMRGLFSFTVEFEECVGEHVTVCKDLIQKQVDTNPDIFEGRTSLDYEVTPVRTPNQDNYYKVGLRTDEDEAHVVGVKGDAMVSYPWQWCVDGNVCYDIGPWDCHAGFPLTVEQCCNMIKATVPVMDVNGNKIDCYVDPPVGSISKPIEYGRVRIIVNEENNVVRPPKNE